MVFDLELAWDRPARIGEGPTPHSLRVRLRPLAGAAARGLPVCLAVALDTSSSMGGDKLVRAKEACTAIAGQLRAEDRLSLAGFASRVQPLFTGLSGGARAVTRTTEAIGSLQASGVTRTDLALGWLRESLPAEAGAARVAILVTDGHPTDPRGGALEDPSPLVHQAGQLGGDGVMLCSAGLGNAAGFNTGFLVDLSNRGHGAFLYAERAEDLAPQLQARLGASQSLAAGQAQLHLETLQPGVRLQGFCRIRPDFVPLDGPPGGHGDVRIGAVSASGDTDLLIRVEAPPPRLGQPAGRRDVLRVTLQIPGRPVETATAALLYTTSYREASSVNEEVQRDRLMWDVNLWSEELVRSDDPNRTMALLTNIERAATGAGQPDMARAAACQRDDLMKTHVMDKGQKTWLLSQVRRNGGTP